MLQPERDIISLLFLWYINSFPLPTFTFRRRVAKVEALHQPKAETGGLFRLRGFTPQQGKIRQQGKTRQLGKTQQQGGFQAKLELLPAGKTIKSYKTLLSKVLLAPARALYIKMH